MKHKKEEIYLDLSKLTSDEQKEVISLLPEPINKDDYDITNRHLYLMYDDDDDMWWVSPKYLLRNRKEITFPEFCELFQTSAENAQVPTSKEVLLVENNEWIKSIAISHQKQMSSTHPHAIIGTIEDAIIEALETFKSK